MLYYNLIDSKKKYLVYLFISKIIKKGECLIAQLKDLIVTGITRLIGNAFVDKIQITSITAPSSSNSNNYTSGTNGQVLKTNSNSIYWDTGAEEEPLTNVENMLTGYGLSSSLNLMEARTDSAETNRAVLTQ